jgi:hypothetical protein
MRGCRHGIRTAWLGPGGLNRGHGIATLLAGGVILDVIAPPPAEFFSETNDNSVAVLLTYSTARVLRVADAEAREESKWPAAPIRGLNGGSMSQNYKTPELRIHALVTEGPARQVELVRAR